MPHHSPSPFPPNASDSGPHTPESLTTYTHPDGTMFKDITEQIKELASAYRRREGFLLLKSKGFSVIIQEARQFVEKDLSEMLLAHANPPDLTSVFQPYQALPIKDGNLSIGRYQSILAVLRRGFSNSALSVVPVSGNIETLLIDTGKDDCPKLIYENSKSNYEERGSERIFDITTLINDAVQRLGIKPCAIYAGTGNTTCVLYNDVNDEGVEGLVARLDAFAPPNLPASAYAHNDLEARRNRSEIPPGERQNGRAHVLAAVLSASLILPNSFPSRVYLVDLDGPRRGRVLHVGVSDEYHSLSKAYK